MNHNPEDYLGEIPDEFETVEILSIAEAASKQDQDTSVAIDSGYKEFNDCIRGGFRGGDVVVITGVEGEGKTTLARMFTLNFAKNNIPTMWFSFEMSTRELWDAFEVMGADTSLMSFVPVELEHEVDWIFRHMEKGIREHGVKAVFIDTIADVSQTEQRRKDAPNYATVIDMLCKDIRDFAVKNELIVFEVAHATKTTKSRSNETENSDIANSAGIKNAATVIFHVWRSNEENNLTHIKVGKSRRDGTARNKKFNLRFTDNRLLMEGRMPTDELEDEFKRR